MQCDLIGQVMDEWVRVHVGDLLGEPHMGRGYLRSTSVLW